MLNSRDLTPFRRAEWSNIRQKKRSEITCVGDRSTVSRQDACPTSTRRTLADEWSPAAHINNLYNTTFWALVLQGGRTTTQADKDLQVRIRHDTVFRYVVLTASLRTGYGLKREARAAFLALRDQLQHRRRHVQEGQYRHLGG